MCVLGGGYIDIDIYRHSYLIGRLLTLNIKMAQQVIDITMAYMNPFPTREGTIKFLNPSNSSESNRSVVDISTNSKRLLRGRVKS